MPLQDQLHFEALSDAQQIFALVKAANPLFAMTQAKFESLSGSQQLYQLLLAIQGGGGGGPVGAAILANDQTFTGNNTFNIAGTKSLVVTGPVDGFVQMNVDAFKVFANNSGFQGHDAAQVVFTLQNAGGQTAHIQDWKDDGGVVMGFVNPLGMISAPGFIGPLTGTATSAATLSTPRTINGVSFNGSANITVPADATTLTGAALPAGVTGSSLTTVGTLTSLNVNGVTTHTTPARSSGVAPYWSWTIPADTGITAGTEAIGQRGTTATRTWAATGTVALQRENYFPGPTYASASPSQTFTDPFNMYLDKPIAGANAIFSRPHTFGILDSTIASSSITGGFIVATTLGTNATSVGIGGGNVNAGGTITSGGATTVGGTLTANGTVALGSVTAVGSSATTALTITQTNRSSLTLPYCKWTIPADTNITNSAECPGIQGVTGTKTWAGTGTVTLQREYYFPGPTYASGSPSQTFTDACTVYIDRPIPGTNAIFSRAHSLAIVDSTTATSSMNGAMVIATALGTGATSLAFGGGAIWTGSYIVCGGNLQVGSKVNSYNGVTTAGWGVPAIQNAGRVTAQTAANANVGTYAVGASDATFKVSGNILVTASTTHTFTMTCTYTDEGNTARTLTLQFSLTAGTNTTSIANANGAVPYTGLELMIRCKAGTNIVFATTGTFTTVTYNAEANVTQIA